MDSELAPQDRPAFPEDAVRWLLGADPRTVVVLSAPQLASAFADYGHDVTNLEGLDGFDGGNERYPQADRSVDAVIATRGVPTNLAEVARILRPGGQLGLICNDRDHRIPWARKLDATLKVTPIGEEPAQKIVNSTLFGFVSESSFRYWQVVNHVSLEEVIRDELGHRRDLDDLVAAALELYSGYGRGADGMQLPWVSRCFRATVVENAWAPPHGFDEQRISLPGTAKDERDSGGHDDGNGDEPNDTGKEPGSGPSSPQDGSDADLLLIDFR